MNPSRFLTARSLRIVRVAPAVGAITLFFLVGVSQAHASSITLAGPGAYNVNTATMDASLGLTGRLIENFEDTTLIAGLSIEYTYPSSSVTLTSLPAVFTVPFNACGKAWDGTHALVNTGQNECWSSGQNAIASTITFHVGGVDFFGIGLADFQSEAVDHSILVNGVQIATVESLANFVSDTPGRNAYLMITADPGEVIDSVGFRLITNSIGDTFMGSPVNQGRPIDGLVFDHLAIGSSRQPTSVPEPGTLLLIGTGAVGLVARRLRKQPVR